MESNIQANIVKKMLIECNDTNWFLIKNRKETLKAKKVKNQRIIMLLIVRSPNLGQNLHEFLDLYLLSIEFASSSPITKI